MVLERRFSRLWLLMACALGFSACLKTAPTKRLQHKTSIAVAIVHDQGSGLGLVPQSLVRSVRASLMLRNLSPRSMNASSIAEIVTRKRATRDRFQSISERMQKGGLLLLVETRARYFSQINGRYRWTVYVKLTLAKSGDTETVSSSSFTVPVLLSFDHERSVEALEYAQEVIANKLGREVDRFLAGLDLETTRAPPKSVSRIGSQELGPIYFVMIDRFHNGDQANDGAVDLADPQAFHGGDIAGLTQKLDYIADLGFRTLWLSPVFAMRTEKIGGHGAFHGYWTDELGEVEPRFGTTEELVALRRALAERGMKLVLDVVLNHVGYDTHLVSEHPEWFHHNGDITKWDDPVQMTTFDVHGLPDLAQEVPAVYDYLLSASARWIELLHPAGFRLDAVKHVGSEFWRRYTADIDRIGGAGFATIGEIYNGDPVVLSRSFADDGFSHVFDFPLYFSMKDTFCKGEHLGRLASTLSLDSLYSDRNHLVTFADNHDVARLWSACGGNEKRVRALLTFLLTARGIPALGYGTERGLEGLGEPENRSDMTFGGKGKLAGIITHLLAARAEHEVLRSGADRLLSLTKEHYAYLRVGATEVALIAVNLGNSPWIVRAPLRGQGVDILAGKSAVSGKVSLPDGVVPPLTTRVLVYPANRMTALATESVSGPRTLRVRAEGETLWLVGAGSALGEWNPEHALAGVKKAPGVFEFEVPLQSGAVVVFKFVRKNGESVQWEEGGNRYFFAEQRERSIVPPQFSVGVGK